METKLYTRLTEVAANVYPLIAPRDFSTPAIVYNRIDTSPLQTFDNDMEDGSVTMQVDIYDKTYKGMKTQARAIRKHLRAWVDADDGIKACLWTNEMEMVDDTTATKLYRTMLRFRIFCTLD